MLAKFDSKSYFNPHSLVIYTRWDKLSFLGKNTYGKIVENNQPSLPFWKTNLKTKLNILIIQTCHFISRKAFPILRLSFTIIADGWKPLSIFAKRFILDVWQDSDYASQSAISSIPPFFGFLTSYVNDFLSI